MFRNQDVIVSSLMKSSFFSKKWKKTHILELRRKINPMILVNQSNDIVGLSIKIQKRSIFLKSAFPWKESCKATLCNKNDFFVEKVENLYYKRYKAASPLGHNL